MKSAYFFPLLIHIFLTNSWILLHVFRSFVRNKRSQRPQFREERERSITNYNKERETTKFFARRRLPLQTNDLNRVKGR